MAAFRILVTVASGAALAVLGGCKVERTPVTKDSSTTAAVTPNGTLLSGLEGDPHLSTVTSALKSTGIAGVFDGKASYTLIAPTDEAFARLGDAGKQLAKPEQKAALAAILRDHIVPGYLTAQDISKAIAAAGGRPVRMRTMGTGRLSFTRSGSDIVVTARDGSTGKLVGEAIAGKTGIALPVDTVLKKV